jgi:hypothetical protein
MEPFIRTRTGKKLPGKYGERDIIAGRFSARKNLKILILNEN